MLHKRRVWQVKDLDPTALASELQRCTWCACTGFRAGGMLWLNDSTSEDGAQEYAVVRERDRRQVESVTVTWCTPDGLKALIERYVHGLEAMEPFGAELAPGALNHGHLPCGACA